MTDRYIRNIVKEYEDIYRVIVYRKPLDREKHKRKKKSATIKGDNPISRLNQYKSAMRSRRTVSDYVHCNDFDLFVTFTFDQAKVNRYDIDLCYVKMQQWLMNQARFSKQNNKQLKYIIVPEKHKDGAIHFHALMSGYVFTLKPTKVFQNNRRVYNIENYHWGFTNATLLPPDDKSKAANYASKYITKDMTTLPNRRRYWCSKNLIKPIVEYNTLGDYEFALGENTLSSVNPYNNVHEVRKEAKG